jgi:hypothetical protein
MHEEMHMLHGKATRNSARRARRGGESHQPTRLAPSRQHNSLREGTALGLVVATCIWVWLATVDAIAGQPFLTFRVLGGIVAFTAMHYVLCVTYGVVIMSGIHGAAHSPSTIFAVGFGFLMIEFAFAFITAVLSSGRLGELAWVRVFGGNVLGAAILVGIVTRRHPLVALLRRAERER